MIPAKILIVDDHKLIRDALKSYMIDDPNYRFVHEAENGVEAMAVLEKDPKINIVLMDISMSEMDGIVCTKKIKEKYPNIGVIALSMFPILP